MKQVGKKSYATEGIKNQSESRLINSQNNSMLELERKLGIDSKTRITQKVGVINQGLPISSDQAQRQKEAIKKMLNTKKLDFILETNNQGVIEAYTKLKNKWKN